MWKGHRSVPSSCCVGTKASLSSRGVLIRVFAVLPSLLVGGGTEASRSSREERPQNGLCRSERFETVTVSGVNECLVGGQITATEDGARLVFKMRVNEHNTVSPDSICWVGG